MKKIKIIFLGVFFLVMLAINLSIIDSKTNGSISLSSLKQAQADIECVTIMCNTGGHGQCYDQRAGYFWATWDCVFTGYQSDYCF
jgi:hypothetical protein